MERGTALENVPRGYFGASREEQFANFMFAHIGGPVERRATPPVIGDRRDGFPCEKEVNH